MLNYYLKLFYVLLLLLLPVAESILGFNNTAEIKCIERERLALLNFKHGLIDAYDMLSTWRDDDKSRDCCKWKGIQCDHQTGHVTILRLCGSDTQYLSGAVNITSLFPLQNIQHLDLSNNFFIGSHIPELMDSLTNLRYLNLSRSIVGGNIPTQLGSLTHLLSLDLSHNYFLRGDIPYILGSLTSLRYLDLSDNNLDGKIPSQLGNLSQLRHLGLSGNSLSGELPFQVGNLPYLQTLRLTGDFDVKPNDADWLSSLSSLTHLAIDGLHNPDWLHMIHYPKLEELRLANCSLSDTHIRSLFYSPSNFSNSLIILDLSSNMLTSSTFQLLSNFSLNLQELYLSHNNIVLSSPVHSTFPSLVILDFSYNKMTSLLFQGIFNFSSKLQNLYLQNCSIGDDSFLMSAISITNSSSSLVSLDLSSNLLKSSSIFYWLFNSTTNLRILELFDNILEVPIPYGFGKVMNSLEFLDFSQNKLQGEIPSSFGNMCTLQRLYLSNNELSGEISSLFQNSSRCNKHVFQSLDLSYNKIIGTLPASLGLLSELEILKVDGNHLEGDITESHLSNLSKLWYLSLSHNSLSLKIVPNWVPPFQIINLKLKSCKMGSIFPSWLQTQRSLVFLDISDNGLKGSVPKLFWNNLQNVQYLNMSQNNLTGAIPDISLKLLNIPSIILNSNMFEGQIPSFLLQASELRLSNNNFSDQFSFICGQSTSAMTILDLSNNQLKGQLPDCWKSIHRLLCLDLSNNKLSGKIPVSMGSLLELEVLILRNNNLKGELASTLKNCSNLIMLDVAENMLSGPIPSWIGESMQQLIILNMRDNHFSRSLPIQLCYLKHIQFLDLSKNMLSKGIPSCLNNLTALSEKSVNTDEITNRSIHWKNSNYMFTFDSSLFGFYTLKISFMWKGVEQWFKNPELQLKSIDLSSNKFTGDVPKEVGYLLGLVSLNLSRNNLSGEIPLEIGNLSLLEYLDLSRNHISGGIPFSLSQIDFLGMLDLSHNSLSGRIPSGRHFGTFDVSSFEGNVGLCGEQLNRTCPEDGNQTTIKPREHGTVNDDEDNGFYQALYMSMGIGYFTGFWGLLGPMLLCHSWKNTYLRFLNRSYISIICMPSVVGGLIARKRLLQL
ncbi:LRR receptor-like serine/threonine-protein kinase GSO2 [Vigna radiata var. radiata]|uniref:LRR receptor-like serine/threonine-protein kinase GSO2 n=1 Tax=Vigna radiata var. radiata TaxID=3916 RepID=A0A1S3UFI1_VIGRR|nr:LRR receptor-like serine/threonine-protein kinase GSO2 [Vigna radiata var. radiata]